MALTATVQAEYPQSDGRKRIRVLLEHASGVSRVLWPEVVEAGQTIQAVVDRLATFHELDLVDAEMEETISLIINGEVDPETAPLRLVSRNALRREVMRRFVNRLRDADSRADKYDVIRRVGSLIEGYSDAQVAGILGWTEQQVATARGKVTAWLQATAALDHGMGEIE